MSSVSLPYLSPANKRTGLAPLLEQPWAMLLDSAGDNQNYNQFDVFCYRPSVTLSFAPALCQTNCDTVHLEYAVPELNPPNLDTKAPLECMRKLLEYYGHSKIQPQKSLPFNGGWLGYISYDFGRQLETLPVMADDDIALPQIQMGLYQWALITDHQQQTTHLFNFGLTNESWSSICAEIEQTITREITPSDNPLKIMTDWKSNTSKEDYYRAFGRIKDYIHAGDCYQVNLAQRFSTEYTGDIFQAYKKLAQANRAPFSAYLNLGDHQIISVSPERFIESHDGKVITQPIKGTRPRSQDPQHDKALGEALKKSPKDRAENLMIVDLLRNDLSRTAAKGSVKVSELFGHYRFESVHHLISTIESTLADDFDNFDLLKTTLPGGSITGAPKIRAMEIIEELEPLRRNLYCGIIGYLDFDGNMDTNICIRTLIAKNGHIYCWAGGGLVADSEADIEYQETFDKLAKILPILDHRKE